ncbi:MarR family transcriptional regulator [Shewanella algae]|uniref:MarR family winged helix-turn-helix transcriptional regulator n=1 Tax=Shewanella algae TaxID=38313 RepID=UPI0031F50992
MSQEELKIQTHKPQAHKPQAKDIKDGVDTIVSQWLAAGVTDDLQPMEVFGRLARIHKHIETEILRCHGEFGLRQGEFDVLATLRRSGEPYTLTPGQLHQSMMLTSGAMTSRLDKLEQKGLICRSHCTEDRRAVNVQLTAEGKAKVEAALPAHMAAQQQLLKGISVKDRQKLAALLKGWLGELES